MIRTCAIWYGRGLLCVDRALHSLFLKIFYADDYAVSNGVLYTKVDSSRCYLLPHKKRQEGELVLFQNFSSASQFLNISTEYTWPYIFLLHLDIL